MRTSVACGALKAIGLFAGVATILMVGGCTTKVPTGQVVATVDGSEIPESALVSEANAAGVNALGGNAATLRATMVRRVVDETVLAQYAQAHNLDQTPEFLADLQRLRRQLLAQAAMRKLQPTPPPVPGDAEIARYVAANPQRFADRVLITADRIKVPSTANSQLDQRITTNDLTKAEAQLRQMGLPFDRKTETIELSSVPAGIARKLSAQPLLQPLKLPWAGNLYIARILDRTTVPTPDRLKTVMARQMLLQEAAARRSQAIVDRLRAKARIAYQAGYVPTGNVGTPID